MSARVLMGAFIVAASASTMAAEESYVIEPVHSQPQWETRHIGMSPQRESQNLLTLEQAVRHFRLHVPEERMQCSQALVLRSD